MELVSSVNVVYAQTQASQGISEPTQESSLNPMFKSELPFSESDKPLLYTNKETQYITDAKGTYPTYSWQPKNQQNVLNHQGGSEQIDGWDAETSWDPGQDDYTKSYIHYGKSPLDSTISLRKYAQQTDQADEFKMKLNVRGNTSYKSGVDIVFLLDNSDSMSVEEYNVPNTRKKDAEQALESLLTGLTKIVDSAKGDIRIGGHIYSDYDINAWGNKPGQISTFPLSNDPSNWGKMLTEYKRADAMGATFTQRGLIEAKDIFDASTEKEKRYKLLFVLTDGAPNLSWPTNDTGIFNENMYVDKLYFEHFNSGPKGNYRRGDVLGTSGFKTTIVPPYHGLINSHITTTNSAAMDVKNAGIEIHTIALRLMVNVNELNKQPELLRGLYKMSSKKINSTNGPDTDTAADYHFYNVEKEDDLSAYFNNWYETITRTIDQGILSDPLGDMVDLIDTPTWKQVDTTGQKIKKEDEPKISVSKDGRNITVAPINLANSQEIEITYTVKLKTTDSSFVFNQWYPTNNLTTLQPMPERTTDQLEFGSPSVKYQQAPWTIPVAKIWSDTYKEIPDYWDLRPEKITVTLQEWVEGSWKPIEEKEICEKENWQTTFKLLPENPATVYRIMENERVSGYQSPTINQATFTLKTLNEEGIKITNELLRENHQFWKFMADGQTVFTKDLPSFSITREDGKSHSEDLQPDDTGKIEIANLSIGRYVVEETYVPNGFVKMVNFDIRVVENSTGDSLVVTIDNTSEQYFVRNVLKDFRLVVEKVDVQDQPLLGAIFKLEGPNGEISQETTKAIHFSGLRPGKYALCEEQAPLGYEKIIEPILFEIRLDGSVEISSHPNMSGMSDLSGNTIKLKVQNKKIPSGSLPNTGGVGLAKYRLLAILLLVIASFTSIFYGYCKYVNE
ncbi:hypothetical protein RV04_GL000363 [Enterococcus hermanniensis]|uniref:VWFA domain-containing protein n=2 Tax=Enterococcus hermanniensis TaxID=249189 RepID=A0A1L8TS10_9ENTE|nr:hypothetical protein RV04_GL000363 [Enterococcus hermanniensis]